MTKFKIGNISPINYQELISEIKPFDLILIKGSGLISRSILLLEKIKMGKEKSIFSHVGMVITRDIVDDPNLEYGKLYIWESVLSGKLGDNVNDIYGKSFLGVQVRDLEEVVKRYSTNKDTAIAWAKLRDNPIEKDINIKRKFTDIYTIFNGRKYDVNIISLLGALFPILRCVRNKVEKSLNTQDWIFCSELCFSAYQSMGLYDSKFNPGDVLPIDFIEGVDLDGIPHNFYNYVYMIKST